MFQLLCIQSKFVFVINKFSANQILHETYPLQTQCKPDFELEMNLIANTLCGKSDFALNLSNLDLVGNCNKFVIYMHMFTYVSIYISYAKVYQIDSKGESHLQLRKITKAQCSSNRYYERSIGRLRVKIGNLDDENN